MADDDNRVKFKGFSGAKKPSGSANPQSSNAKFRHQAIAFVSAGVPQSAVEERHQQLQGPPTGSKVAPDNDDSENDDNDDDDDFEIYDSTIQTNIHLEADIESTEDGVAKMAIDRSEVMDMDIETVTTSTDTRIIIDDEPQQEPAPELQFVVDTVGDESLVTTATSSRLRGKRPVREPSPARSESSEEAVVFKGRSKATVIDDPFSAPPRQTLTATPTARVPRPSPHPLDDLEKELNNGTVPSKSSHAPNTSTNSQVEAWGWGSVPSKYDLDMKSDDQWEPATGPPYWRKQKGKPRPDLDPPQAGREAYGSSSAKRSKDTFAEAQSSKPVTSAVDNIASLQSEWRTALREKKASKKEGQMAKRNGGVQAEDFENGKAKENAIRRQGESSKSASRPDRRGKRGRKADNRSLRTLITDDDDGANEEAAYDDYMENLIAQMDDQAGDPSEEMFLADLKATATLNRPSLMVDGRVIPDDELLTHVQGNDDNESNDDHNDEWESVDDDDSNSDGMSSINPDMDELSSDGLESELAYNEQEMWEDEEDIRQRRREQMTDEELARLLSKQQEFGMHGDELMIDDGGMYGSDDGVGDVKAARRGLSNLTNLAYGQAPNKNRMRRRGRDKKNNFVDASLLADTVEQYGENGFDVMDFERPSLRPLRKGRKGKVPPELDAISDDELRETLSEQWNKDRSKKAQKKLEREELRREGLLGSSGKKGRAHLGTKYPLGMSMRDVHDELREFLQDEDLEQRAFPPMDKKDRAALHNICNALNLSSRSQGVGKNRFPVLSKTARTAEYSEEVFVKVVSASSRGFLSNRGAAKKFSKQISKGPGRGGGFNKDAVTVRNGEVVGGSAPAISHTSFGAKLMGKYGWSSGMGLGKANEGRTVPVEQIMRTGTAGLG